MKFAHEYEAALKQEGYPDRWVQSAISYRQLKKCIKKVEMELSHIGLDPETLGQLWQSLKVSDVKGAPFQYRFEGKPSSLSLMLLAMLKPTRELNNFCAEVDLSCQPEKWCSRRCVSQS